MRILFPIGSFYPSQQGGPCNSVYALARGLVREGHEVRVVTTDYDIPVETGMKLNAWVDVDGIKVYYIRVPGVTKTARAYMFYAAYPRIIERIMEGHSVDIVHSTVLFYPIPHMGAHFAKRKGLPLIWSPRGTLLPYTLARGNLKKRMFLSMPWVRKGLSDCHFHTTSEEEHKFVGVFFSEYIGDSLDGRVHQIPNAVDSEAYEMGCDRSPYPFKYILHLGRVHPKKNIEGLINAFHRAQIDPSIRLVNAGWTGEVPEYTRQLKDMVKKLGLGERILFTERRVESAEKAAIYRNAEVFILPSHSENFGMVVVEAMAQETPVIASHGTPWQIVADRGAGAWVSNDPETLSKTIEEIVTSPESRKLEMGRHALTLAREYSDKALRKKYLEMYEKMLDSQSGYLSPSPAR